MRNINANVWIPIGNPWGVDNSKKILWLREHSADYGYVDGIVAGIYLTREDAIAYKLIFGS